MAAETREKDPVKPKGAEELRERLRRFLSVHLNTKILDNASGTLKMMVLLAKNQNSKIKDKLINYKLSEISKRLLLEKGVPGDRELIICEFLIEELEKYVATRL